jgi:hypothetical protein
MTERIAGDIHLEKKLHSDGDLSILILKQGFAKK